MWIACHGSLHGIVCNILSFFVVPRLLSVLAAYVPFSRNFLLFLNSYVLLAHCLILSVSLTVCFSVSFRVSLSPSVLSTLRFLIALESPTNGAVINVNASTMNVTIGESSDPHGVLGFAVADATVEMGGVFNLALVRSAGTYGEVRCNFFPLIHLLIIWMLEA